MNSGTVAERLGYWWGVFVRETWDVARMWWLYRWCKCWTRGKMNGRYPEGLE